MKNSKLGSEKMAENEKCEKCIFEAPCHICTYVSERKRWGQLKKLKFKSYERRELDSMRNRDLHLLLIPSIARTVT